MSSPFYRSAGGLRFACTRCGNCCVRPGPVYFSPADLERVAAVLELTPEGFRGRYKTVLLDGLEAIDPPEGPCPFYEPETGCTIYDGRPTQCRTWPFWSETVRRQRSWERAARECPGMGQGTLHTPRAIETALELCEQEGLPDGDPW